jgi:hypothetical protein
VARCECGEEPVLRQGYYICANPACEGYGQICDVAQEEIDEIARLARDLPLPRSRAHRLIERVGKALEWSPEKVEEEKRRRDEHPYGEEDPFPLVEETSSPSELPTASEWLRAGGPMREV